MTDATIMYVFLFVSLYFEVFMLVSFLERRGQKTVESIMNLEKLPHFAVVVPAYNEENSIGATIESLLQLNYPKDKLDIIVVDDGSRDETYKVAMRYTDDPRVQVYKKENGGKYTAMNFALARTNAEFIGCLDADSTVAPDALRNMVPAFQDPKVAAVTPGVLIKKPETLLQYMQEAEYRLSVFNRFTQAALGAAFITPGAFSMFRVSFVRATGGWRHAHSTEDLEMALRIQDSDYIIGNAPGAVVYTGTPRTFAKLFHQRVRWTYGFLRNALDYKHMFGNPRYGNLGLVILPTAVVSIGIALYFFIRIVYYTLIDIGHIIMRYEIAGFFFHPAFNPFYINTSAMWFLIYASVTIVIALVCTGSFIGTGRAMPPRGTPLFVIFYCFLVPTWLGTAVIRAVFKTGVRWR
ncbi:MAG TPA: glycosyltransferase [Candidatus Paceibacterota bacterium]|nr:glycosyltransferase [Candidatus Paceibacterota bacterium]